MALLFNNSTSGITKLRLTLQNAVGLNEGDESRHTFADLSNLHLKLQNYLSHTNNILMEAEKGSS